MVTESSGGQASTVIRILFNFKKSLPPGSSRKEHGKETDSFFSPGASRACSDVSMREAQNTTDIIDAYESP